MKKCILFVVFLCAANPSSIAQIHELPQNYDWSATTLLQDNTPTLKSPNKAMWISVGSTIGTYLALTGLAAFENPSPVLFSFLSFTQLGSPAFGYLYTNNWNDFWNSVARRAVGQLVMGTGVVMILLGSLDDTFSNDEDNNDLLIVAGFGLLLGGAIHNLRITFRDFRQVRTRVHEYNEGLVQSVHIAPVIDPINKAVGLGFRVNF